MPRKPRLRTANTKVATRVENEFVVVNSGLDEHGRWLWLQIDANDYDGFAATPKVLAFDGLRWKRMGWNSDNGHVFYRVDRSGIARAVEEKTRPAPAHNCDDHASYITWPRKEGGLGHGYECAICHKFLQAG